MSDQVNITSETALMMGKMMELDAEDPRYKVLQAALGYKAAWLELGEQLNVIAENKTYKTWNYKTFKTYCQEELLVPQATARKLVRGFQWIDREAPEFLPNPVGDVAIEVPRVVPDVDMVNVLINAEKEVANDRLSAASYNELKQKALSGGHTGSELRKEFKEALPAPAVDQNEEEIKALRKSLTATERLVTQLEGIETLDHELMELATKLRERMFEVVSNKLDARAYGQASEA